MNTMMNCNPDSVYETGRTIDSAEQAIALLRERCLAKTFPSADIDTCRIKVHQRPDQPREAGDIDWKRLAKRMVARRVGKRTVYDLVFSIQGCGSNSYHFQVSSDGWFSHRGCCGK